MSFWDQVKLIFLKDARRLWWALAVIAVILIASACVDLYDPWAFEVDEGDYIGFLGYGRTVSSTLSRCFCSSSTASCDTCTLCPWLRIR